MHDSSTEWWPIDTAPYDKPILIWDGKMMCAAKKVKYTYSAPWPDLDDWICVGASGWECENDFKEPTHWLPLPEPPRF